MKDQTNLIWQISLAAAIFIALLIFYFTKPEPVKPAPPTDVVTTNPKMPDATVTMANGLPGSGGSGSGNGGKGGGGFGGNAAAGRPSASASGGGAQRPTMAASGGGGPSSAANKG